MSSLAGWYGAVREGSEVLRRMAEVMSGPRPEIAQHMAADFALTTTQPAIGAVERIAASDDGQVILGFAGHLSTDDSDACRFPARYCLGLYLEHGLAFPERVHGSFAIVIHDARCSELHLITDRLLSRAICYHTGNPFLFASEVKPILEFPGVSRKLNGDRMVEFLAVQRLGCLDTYYDHIKRLPEASVATWDGTELRSTSYWKPPLDTEKCWSITENAKRLHRALQNATRRACEGAERPALMLSGGLDSRSIASTCAARLLCCTMHTRPAYEVRIARRVAHALGHEHQFVQVPRDYPLARVTDGSLISDGMNAFHHSQPLYLSDMLIERGVDRLLNGTYLERYFAQTGLPRRRWMVLGRQLRVPVLAPDQTFDVARWVRDRRSLHPLVGTRQLVDAERLEHVLGQARDRTAARGLSFADSEANPNEIGHFAGSPGRALSMTHLTVQALERLVPAPLISFDGELMDLYFTIPAQHRIYHRLYACMFTTVDRRCRWIPYSNTGAPVFNSAVMEFVAASLARPPFRAACAGLRRLSTGLGETFERRSWPRIATAMRECPSWHDYLRAKLASSRLMDMGLVRGDELRRMVEEQIAGTGNTWCLLGNWITLEEWLAHYG